MQSADPEYEYEEQFLFTNVLLDGHHRVQAAVDLGTPIRILALVAKDRCLVQSADDIELLLGLYAT
jgi:hypothetical protein